MKVKWVKKIGVAAALILALLAQLVMPWNTARAATGIGSGSTTDLTGTGYLVIHNTTGSYPLGGPSKLKIMNGGVEITPDASGAYNNVPAGATIELTLAFHLEDGDGVNFFDYEGGETFTVTLPEGIDFTDTTSPETITAYDNNGNYDYPLATWTLSGRNLTVTLTDNTADHGGAANDDHQNKWGKITINGTFEALTSGGGTQTRIEFGDQTVVINREPLPEQAIFLAKTGVYDASTNTITWTVTVDTPDDATDLSGYSLVDVYGDNQDYVAGSFTPTVSGSPIADIGEGLTVDTGSRTLTYIFPDPTSGDQAVTYKTTPTTFAGETGNATTAEYATYKNTVYLKDTSDTDAATPKTAECTLDWISKGGVSAATAADPSIVKWTVTVTVPGEAGKAITGAQIIDTLPPGTELDTSYPVHIKIGSFETDVGAGTASEPGKYDVSGSTLTYTFPVDSQPAAGTTATLTFYTKVPAGSVDGYLDSNGNISFINTAQLDWTENGTGTYPADKASVTAVGAGGLLIKAADPASEQYDHVGGKDIIKWTVTVNQNKVTMTNASVTDTIPAGQVLLIDVVEHPFTVSPDPSGTLTGIDGDSSFTYAFPGTINTTYTITFYTKIVDTATGAVGDTSGLDTLYGNGDIKFKNDVTLHYTSGTAKTVSVSGTKTYDSQMLDKTVVEQPGGYTYNYDDHTVQWQIVVNRNRLPLTNATVTDNIAQAHPGMKLLIDGAHPFTVTNDTTSTGATGSLTTGNTGSTSFIYTLPSPTSDQYTVTFWTKLEDDALISQWNGNRGFENEVTLKADEIPPAGISDDAMVQVKNPVVSKTYSRPVGSYTIDWMVEINPGQVPLTDGAVTDELISGLQLVESSVALYEATVNPSTGGLTANVNPVDTTSYSKTVVVDPTTHKNTLTVNLPTPTSKAYVLTFTTNILQGDLPLTNEVSLSGTGSTNDNTDDITQITINDLYGSGGSGGSSITVTKTDDNTTAPLNGAKFRLLNVYQVPVQKGGGDVTAMTDGSGTAIFNALPSWKFYVEEIAPAPGYLLPAAPADRVSAEIDLSGTSAMPSFTNALALASVSFTKVAADGTPISGGSFELRGTPVYAGASSTTIVGSNTDGTVTFTDVPIGTYGIYELSAPAGHAAPNPAASVGTVTVRYAGGGTDYTGVEVLVSIGSHSSTAPGAVNLANVPNATDVSFTKKNAITGAAITVPAPLSGGSFTLTGTDYTGTAVSKTASADDNGVVTFTGVPLGGATPYVIAETAAPVGYLLPILGSQNILQASVHYNTAHTALEVTLTDMAGDPLGASAPANAPALGTFSFQKQSTGGALLSGGVFTLTGKDYKDSDVTLTFPAVSGVVTFTGVPLSKTGEHYTVKETTAPGGYYLTNAELTVTVAYSGPDKTGVVTTLSDGAGHTRTTNADGSVTGDDIVMKNTPIPDPIKGTVEITKTDEDGSPLAGAEFTLYNAGGFAVGTAVSGADGIASFTNVYTGSYTVRETKAPEGYAADPAARAVTVSGSGTVRFTFVNTKLVVSAPAAGSIQIKKADKNGEALAGAEFTLYNGNGTAVATAVSGADGLALFAGLAAGGYTVRETKAPEGYALFTEPLAVTLGDGEALEYTLRNVLATDDDSDVLGWDDGNAPAPGGTLPQTGGAAGTFYMTIAGLALFAGGLLLAEPKKGRKKNRA